MPSRAGNHVICEHLSSRYLQYLKLRTICRKRPLPELDGSMRMRVLKLWLAWADSEAPVSQSALQATLNVRNVANSTFKAALARLVTRSKPKSSSFLQLLIWLHAGMYTVNATPSGAVVLSGFIFVPVTFQTPVSSTLF